MKPKVKYLKEQDPFFLIKVGHPTFVRVLNHPRFVPHTLVRTSVVLKTHQNGNFETENTRYIATPYVD